MESTSVGVISARITADVSGFNEGIDKAKAKAKELGVQGKQAAADFARLGAVKEKIAPLAATLEITNIKIEQQRQKLGKLKESYNNTFNDTQKSKLQEQITSTEASLMRLTQTSDSTAKKIWALEDGAGKAAVSFKSVSDNLRELGVRTSDIDALEKSLKKANPELLRSQIAEVTAEMKELGATDADIDKVTKSIERSATGASSAQKELKALGVAYIGLAVATTAVISKSVAAAAEFEQSMANVKAISQATGAEFESLRNQALKLGATTKFTAAESADAQALLAQAGMKTNQILAAMPGVLSLAAAGQIDLATTADITASVLNGFGLAAEETGRLVDVLAKSSIDTNADVTDLGFAMKYLAPVAASMGVSIEEATAAVGELSNAGIKGEMAGTQMRAILLALASPSKEAAGYMDTLGISISDTAGNIKPLSSIIGDLQGAFARLTEVQQADVAATLVGREATAGLLTLISNGQSTFDNYTASLENAGGTAERVAGTQMDTLKGAITEMKSALEGVGIVVGDKFAPAIRGVTEMITGMLSGFTNLNPILQSAIIAFAAAVPLILGLAATIGAVTIAIKALEISFPVLIAVSVAVGLVVAGITALVSSSSAASDAVKKHDEAQKSLNETLNQSPTSRTVSELEELRVKTEELSAALDERAALQERINEIEALGEIGEGTPQLIAEMVDINDQLEEMDDNLRGMGYDGVEDATAKLNEMNAAIENSVPALFAEKEAELADLAAKNQKITAMETTLKRYNELQSAQSLDEAQKQELIALTKALRGEYPQLNATMDDNNRIRIDNLDVVASQIQADRDFITQNVSSSKTYINNLKVTTEAQRASVEAQIKNYKALSSAMQAALGGTKKIGPEGPVKTQTTGIYNPAQGVYDLGVKRMQAENDAKISEASKSLEEYAATQRKMDDSLAKLSNGEIPTGKITSGSGVDFSKPAKEKKAKTSKGKKPAKEKKAKKEKSPAEIAADLRKKAYDADLATTRYQSDIYDLSAEDQMKKYEALQKKHAVFLKESVDDARTLNLQLKRLNEDTVKARYDFSATWIDAEEKRMEDSGKTELQIAQTKLTAWTRIRDRYKKDSDEYKSADDQVRQSRKKVAQETATQERELYGERTKLIAKEVRRLEDSGATEAEVAKYKLEAWTKLRDKYKMDSEYYEKADEEIYQARKGLVEKTEKLAEALVKKQKAAIDDAKKADLAAIEERKVAFVSAQDAKIKAIDDLIAKEAEQNSEIDYETQLREKNARIDELASAVGPGGIAEREQAIIDRDKMILDHERELRKAELTAQKTALQEEKDTQTHAFDAEKDATTKQYDALKSAFDEYSGDIKTIEAAVSAFRVDQSATANATILTQLDSFVSEYNAKMATLTTVKAAAQGDSDLAEYNANKDAWTAAKASGNTSEAARLAARNEELRKQYGITKDTGKLQAFKVGGVVEGPSGSAVPVIAHAGEMILNSAQQATLFGLLNGNALATPSVSGVSNTTSITNHIDMSVNDVELTDKADITTLYDERARVATRAQTLGVKGL